MTEAAHAQVFLTETAEMISVKHGSVGYNIYE